MREVGEVGAVQSSKCQKLTHFLLKLFAAKCRCTGAPEISLGWSAVIARCCPWSIHLL